MEELKLLQILEALLFISGKELKLARLSEIIDVDKKNIQIAMEKLQKQYVGRGIQIRELAEGYQMTTIQEVAPYLEKFAIKTVTTSLSSAALETLAIIAYKQPLTRAEIENIRGVKAEKALNSLLEKGLIEEIGRKDSIGKPIIYGTTNFFLQHFGMKNLKQLPALEKNS